MPPPGPGDRAFFFLRGEARDCAHRGLAPPLAVPPPAWRVLLLRPVLCLARSQASQVTPAHPRSLSGTSFHVEVQHLPSNVAARRAAPVLPRPAAAEPGGFRPEHAHGQEAVLLGRRSDWCRLVVSAVSLSAVTGEPAQPWQLDCLVLPRLGAGSGISPYAGRGGWRRAGRGRRNPASGSGAAGSSVLPLWTGS